MKLELDIKVNNSEFDIYLSDDCGSGISIVGKTHKEVLDNLIPYIECYLYNVYFQVKGVNVISRGDYENLPISMCTKEVSNETMQKIADEIFNTLTTNYDEADVIAYFRNEVEDDELREDIDEDFWKEMENIGIDNGITYYEDMEEWYNLDK